MRIRNPGLTAALAAALLAPLSHAAGERDFCKQYRAIVADARNGFSGFRGKRIKQEKATVAPFGTIDFYAATGWPDGALNCHIEMRDEATEDGHQYPNYYCEFPMLAADKGKALRRLADRIAACTPGVSRPSGTGLDKEGGMLTWHSKNYDVHYSGFAGPSNANLRILVQAEKR
ncbi:MAG TPA: hypothetical protein VMU01_05800 [Rhizomicrobium sp.]|nr:hypothetical protein [Rhizomicrobium sp.]